jgi:hypothetical protein
VQSVGRSETDELYPTEDRQAGSGGGGGRSSLDVGQAVAFENVLALLVLLRGFIGVILDMIRRERLRVSVPRKRGVSLKCTYIFPS